VDSLAYDPNYYRVFGDRLTERLAGTANLRVISKNGSELVYRGPFEPAKKNSGDYRGMENIGGTFPIGEVFSELVDLSGVSGTASIFAYGGMDFRTRIVPPFQIRVEQGLVVEAEASAPEEFHEILAMVKANEQPCLRELGLGLNKAFSKERPVSDITTFERQVGVHVSLGEKHTIYKKEGLRAKDTKYHIDLFIDVNEVWFDDEVGFKDGAFVL
jgi:leucyl aminopeptidase (aminopeptidase T)